MLNYFIVKPTKSPIELIEHNDRHLYDLAEIFLGLLDIVEEDREKEIQQSKSFNQNYNTDKTGDTEELCNIESGNTLYLNDTPSDFSIGEILFFETL